STCHSDQGQRRECKHPVAPRACVEHGSSSVAVTPQWRPSSIMNEGWPQGLPARQVDERFSLSSPKRLLLSCSVLNRHISVRIVSRCSGLAYEATFKESPP